MVIDQRRGGKISACCRYLPGTGTQALPSAEAHAELGRPLCAIQQLNTIGVSVGLLPFVVWPMCHYCVVELVPAMPFEKTGYVIYDHFVPWGGVIGTSSNTDGLYSVYCTLFCHPLTSKNPFEKNQESRVTSQIEK
jgi:hypothetical protein